MYLILFTRTKIDRKKLDREQQTIVSISSYNSHKNAIRVANKNKERLKLSNKFAEVEKNCMQNDDSLV